jgi:hypothetical protein
MLPIASKQPADRLPRTARERIALDAIRWAAKSLRIAPEELRVTQYRALRVRLTQTDLPDDGAIRGAFGGWERARERAAGEIAPPS